MKLNIGAGNRHLKGYTTIDIEEKNHPEVLGDFRTMNFGGIEEIRAEHILEHFGRDESQVVLNQWNSWLMDGGRLIIETPDLEYICKDWDKDHYWMTRHIYGSQEADWAYHRDGWYEGKFRKLLPELGFEIESIQRNCTHGNLPNIKVVAIKRHGV